MNISITIDDKSIDLCCNQVAKSAGASVIGTCGNTKVLCTVCTADTDVINTFANLHVVYEEPRTAFGKIPGGYFKREGKPSEREVLISRLIDRSIRPMIPGYFCDEIQLICSVLCYDGQNDPVPIALNAASAAVMLSGVPMLEAIMSLRFKYSDGGKMIINPTSKENEDKDQVYGTLSITKQGIAMIEIQSYEADGNAIQHVFDNAVTLSKPAIDAIEGLRVNHHDDQHLYYQNIDACKARIMKGNIEDFEKSDEELLSKFSDITSNIAWIKHAITECSDESSKKSALQKNIRGDNRQCDTLREINVEAPFLPVGFGPHGSAVFSRGNTQVMALTTLGTSMEKQSIEFMEHDLKEGFILHYNFPGYSVGSVGRIAPPGRREIGHGALAKKAIVAVMPKDFDHTVRILANVLESDGSSSMATICASSLSLMHAGVPIKCHVSGVAMGLLREQNSQVSYKILTDISGKEDGFSEMDFKIGRTRQGICAIQMDTKGIGIPAFMLIDAVNQSHAPCMTIIDAMEQNITAPKSISSNAPKTKTLKVEQDKIKNLIGAKGKNVKRICADYNVKIDIAQDGNVTIAYDSQDILDKVIQDIQDSTRSIAFGDQYTAKVVSIIDEKMRIEVSFLNNRERGYISLDSQDDLSKYNAGDTVCCTLKKKANRKAGTYKHQMALYTE